MSYQIDYTGLELNKTCKASLTPEYFGYKKDDDVPDVITIIDPDVYQTYIPDTSNMSLFATSEFSYNNLTGEITYTGIGTYFDIDGCVSIGYPPNPNTIIHFGVCVNETLVAEGSAKAESTTAIESLSLSTFITPYPLVTNDVITIDVKSDKAGTINAWHVQGKIKEVKPA